MMAKVGTRDVPSRLLNPAILLINDEQVFRLILIVGLVSVCSIGIPHRLKSLHLLAEAIKVAKSDIYHYVGDPEASVRSAVRSACI